MPVQQNVVPVQQQIVPVQQSVMAVHQKWMPVQQRLGSRLEGSWELGEGGKARQPDLKRGLMQSGRAEMYALS